MPDCTGQEMLCGRVGRRAIEAKFKGGAAAVRTVLVEQFIAAPGTRPRELIAARTPTRASSSPTSTCPPPISTTGSTARRAPSKAAPARSSCCRAVGNPTIRLKQSIVVSFHNGHLEKLNDH